MRDRRLAGSAAAVAALLLLVGCASAPTAPAPAPTESAAFAPGDGVLRIGTLLPTTGSSTTLGPGLLAGVRAAVRDMNAQDGVLDARVELVSRSSGSDVATLEASFAELIERDVDAIVGPADAALAVRAGQLAAEAGIPIIAVGTSSLQVSGAEDGDWLFRTTPAADRQGALLGQLLPEQGQNSVAIVYTDGPAGFPVLTSLASALADHGGDLVAVRRIDARSDLAAIAESLAGIGPDVVVLATGDGGSLTQAAIAALTDAGLGGERLWLTSRNAVDFSESLGTETLDGVNAILDGNSGDDAFRASIKQEDPMLRSTRYAADAYDATILLGLSALAAGGDAGWQLRDALREVAAGGTLCRSFGECALVIADGQNPDYDGVSGPLDFDAAGDVRRGSYAVSSYTGDGGPIRHSDAQG